METEQKINEILTAIKGPLYNAVEEKSRVQQLAQVMVLYTHRRGVLADKEQCLFAARILDADILRYYGGEITFDEARLAIDWGIHGEWGEYTGINADRLFKHVASYYGCDERPMAIRRRNEAVRKKGLLPMEAESNFYTKHVNEWNGAYNDVLAEWRAFGQGSFRPCTANGVDTPMRHRRSRDYLWLRSVGIVGQGAADTERGYLEATAKTFPDWSAYQVAVYAGAALLQGFFTSALGSGYDLEGRMERMQKETSDDAKFNMKWFELKMTESNDGKRN